MRRYNRPPWRPAPFWALHRFDGGFTMMDGVHLADIHRAAQALANGDIVAIPTETVYGLAANANNDVAVANIFSAKGRPSDHPLIVHVADAEAVARFAKDIPDFATALMRQFWPGPLTLIVPRRGDAAQLAAGGQASVGVRCPSHPVAQALLRACQTMGVWGLAAPSANQFGRISPTTSAHVRSDFGPELMILEGGACAIGIESTIIDCTRGVPVLLRPGMVDISAIEQALGCKVWRAHDVLPSAGHAASHAPRASGTLQAHYAPRAPLYCLPLPQLVARVHAQPEGTVCAVYTFAPLTGMPPTAHWVAMPTSPNACAQALFAQLRQFDLLGVQSIWVQCPPDTPEWEGVADRLRRAAAAA